METVLCREKFKFGGRITESGNLKNQDDEGINLTNEGVSKRIE
jgi:hypothetical protein